MKWKIGSSGFTLMEVMVALGIVGLALFGLLEAHLLSLDLWQRTEDRALAKMLAREKMCEVELMDFSDIAEQEGDFEELHPGYKWRVVPEEVDLSANLLKVTVIIGGPSEEVQLTTYIANVKPALPGETPPAAAESQTALPTAKTGGPSSASGASSQSNVGGRQSSGRSSSGTSSGSSDRGRTTRQPRSGSTRGRPSGRR